MSLIESTLPRQVFVMLIGSNIIFLESTISSPTTQIKQLHLCQSFSFELFYLLIHVSCWWWGIDHFPPSTSLFLSTSTHHPGIRPTNHSLPWNLHALMVATLIFDNWFTSLTSDQKILWMFNFNSFIHISLECTIVPWDSSTLLVISLTFVNCIH